MHIQRSSKSQSNRISHLQTSCHLVISWTAHLCGNLWRIGPIKIVAKRGMTECLLSVVWYHCNNILYVTWTLNLGNQTNSSLQLHYIGHKPHCGPNYRYECVNACKRWRLTEGNMFTSSANSLGFLTMAQGQRATPLWEMPLRMSPLFLGEMSCGEQRGG